MKLFRFRALITLDPDAELGGEFASGTRALLVRNASVQGRGTGKFFQSMITWDDDGMLRPGDHAVVTLTIADTEAPAFLPAGQHFPLWGGATGHGVVTRQVYTSSGPS